MKRALVLLVLAGCPDPDYPPDLEIFSITGPPPASKATITNNERDDVYHIEMSAGVAIAAHCWHTCATACVPKAVVVDESVMHVRPVYRVNGGSSELALIAKQPGTTAIRVDSGCYARTYTVTVLPR